MTTDYKALKEGGFMRQRQKDRFSLRLKVVGGNLTTEQFDAIIEVARQFGDGHVHLTSRQGVEIPFIKLEDVETVKARLAQSGVEPGACGPRVRTVTACQGSAICPAGCIDTYPLAQEFSDRYFGRQLPHKFKFGVTGCKNNCLKAEENDFGVKGGYSLEWHQPSCTLCGVCVKVCRDDALRIEGERLVLDEQLCSNCGRCVKSCPTDAWIGTPGYLVSFGGTFGNYIAKGKQVVPIIEDREKLFKVADATLGFFDEHAKAGERLRLTIERVGWDRFKETIQEAYHA